MSYLPTATSRADFDVQAGDTSTIGFPIVDSTGAAIDVTGWTAHAQLRFAPNAALLYEWHTSPTGTQGQLTTSSSGVALALDGPTTAAWAWKRDSHFDLLIYEPSGTPHVVAAGRVRVIPAITQGV